MTTIAYHHKDKEIAWDSRRTNRGLITSDTAEKLIEREGVKFWFAGCFSDFDRFIDYYFGRVVRNEFVPDCEAFVFDGGVLYRSGVTNNHELWKEVCDCNMHLGSGGLFALVAMDFGSSASEAVEYAKTRDCYSGGAVKVCKL